MVRSSVREDILKTPGLGEDRFDYFTANIGQTEIAALRAVGQFFVIDTKETKHGCVQIMDVDRIFDGIVTEFIGPADCLTAFDSAARHPDGKPIRVMIATVGIAAAIHVAVAHGRAAESPPQITSVDSRSPRAFKSARSAPMGRSVLPAISI